MFASSNLFGGRSRSFANSDSERTLARLKRRVAAAINHRLIALLIICMNQFSLMLQRLLYEYDCLSRGKNERHLVLRFKKFIDSLSCTWTRGKSVIIENHEAAMLHAWVNVFAAILHGLIYIYVDMGERNGSGERRERVGNKAFIYFCERDSGANVIDACVAKIPRYMKIALGICIRHSLKGIK